MIPHTAKAVWNVFILSSSSRAPVVVVGATGHTGRLVCGELARAAIPFAAAGRDAARLASVAGAAERLALSLDEPGAVEAALTGRRVVLACAGPFAQVGEPVLATAARLGLAYADTTGEQTFVIDMAARYRATAEARGAVIAPSMAYEIAPADWAAALAAEALGGAPDALDIAYVTSLGDAGGYGPTTSMATKLSALGVMTEGRVMQRVAGALVAEAFAQRRRAFTTTDGRTVTAVSFPSPEALLTAQHTKAQSLTTYTALGPAVAWAAQKSGPILPRLARVVAPLAERAVRRGPARPAAASAAARFEIIAEAKKGERTARAMAAGHDAYGLTAAIQRLFAERALAGAFDGVRGFLAASELLSPAAAAEALSTAGLTVRRL